MSNKANPVIRWGVAGCGQIAVDKTIPGLLSAAGARLVAIADPLVPRRELALALAAKAGLTDVRTYDYDVELFQDPDIDAVYIAMPTGLHLGAVLAAAKAKKAILCEKPLGNSAAEVRAMVLAARASGSPLMTAYMSRFSDVYQKCLQLLRGGALGKVTYVTAHFSYDCASAYPPGATGGWRYTDPAGGGPLLDIGVYLAFALRELLGERLAQVAPLHADVASPPGSQIRDTTAAWFVTDKGTPGTFVTTFSHDELVMTFYGAKANLTLREHFYQTSGATLQLTKNRTTTTVLDTKEDPGLSHCDNYRREFEHFSRALATKTPHAPSAEDVLADALLLDTLKRSVSPLTVPSPEDFLKGGRLH